MNNTEGIINLAILDSIWTLSNHIVDNNTKHSVYRACGNISPDDNINWEPWRAIGSFLHVL